MKLQIHFRFNKSDLDFSEVCEYTKEKKIFKVRFYREKRFICTQK